VPGSPDSADRRYGDTIAVAGIGELAPLFDGFIVDQWGVLHDGTKPYPGALGCLETLRAAGKHIVVLTNSGRSEAANVRLMEEMGFPAHLFDRFVCAGDDARRAIATRATPFHARLGRRCYAFTRGGERALLEGLGLDFVARVEDADFLVALGIDSPARGLADYEAELAVARARGLPMVCANPDVFRFVPGRLVDAPGVLARRYEELGGAVFYHGKPHPAIYESCLAALAHCAPGRVVAGGDSIEHDVQGAARAGLASALVVGGVHAGELGVAWGELPTPAAWRAFADRAPARPTYLVPRFIW
jgi:HAD superfamily hydrolase (TIGR01459 family)